MSPFWLTYVSAACPLRIERVEWHDPQLTIGGSNWYFNTIAPWRLLSPDRLITGTYDEGFEMAVQGLVGLTITGCSSSRHAPRIDPCFILSNGQQLEIFSTCALEPWTMKLPKPPILVASPSDPSWAE